MQIRTKWCWTFAMPQRELKALHTHISCNPQIVRDSYHYYPHLTQEETESEKPEASCVTELKRGGVSIWTRKAGFAVCSELLLIGLGIWGDWTLSQKLGSIFDTGMAWTELCSGKVTWRAIWTADHRGERLEERRPVGGLWHNLGEKW